MPVSRKSAAPPCLPPTLAGVPGFPAPYWGAAGPPGAALYLGDVRACLRGLPTRSVHCCVTSPPYWGLRDYSICTCRRGRVQHPTSTLDGSQAGTPEHFGRPEPMCQKCGGTGHVNLSDQIGMEDVADCLGWATGKPCGACYVCHMVEVFSEARRVLRDDGTLWLNLGDTFDGGQGMVPAAVAMALRADGWKLVQDIIWYSPNKMPESVDNRCTKSHEHIFLLAKGPGYYYDAVAIQEPAKSKYRSSDFLPNSDKDAADGTRLSAATGASPSNRDDEVRSDDVNKRDVRVVPTRGYSGAHFATFSSQLITPCVLAGTSEHGRCAACGRPYKRVAAKGAGTVYHGTGPKGTPPGQAPDSTARGDNRDRSFDWSRNGKPGTNSTLDGTPAARETVGWRKTCGCRTDEVAPCVVLDPFVGSGTTVATALQLGRAGVGVDLSETYLRENAVPRIEAALRGEGSGGKVRARKVSVALKYGTPPAPQRLP